ncbi:uncharacterized protein LTR77_005965 [Saxophila tyrrhenica]|uniref:Uncharacterized protein n=1 Tax=Saxophila tyrrhenica TaxID=1690608 RepID=A0AAV9P6T9_9PEZI|nr:hypothetical protein LTR77_005965 [Saxophila tyrrhenica]
MARTSAWRLGEQGCAAQHLRPSTTEERQQIPNMRILSGLTTPDTDATRLQTSNVLKSIRHLFVTIADAFKCFGLAIRDAAVWCYQALKQCGAAIKSAVIWLYHAPGKLVHLVAHIVGVSLRWLKGTALLALKIGLGLFAVCLAALIAYALIRLALQVQRARRARQELRRLEEARVQWAIQARGREEERHRHLVEEQQRREDEVRREEEAGRQRAAEQKRMAQEADETKRQTRVREELQQRRRDAIHYKQWRDTCDRISDAGTGTLPKPPSWSCFAENCQKNSEIVACCHDLKRAFGSTGDLAATVLLERNWWHPDRPWFRRLGPESQVMATEMFKTIQNIEVVD